jgi:SAM-dependent methyltransferase
MKRMNLKARFYLVPKTFCTILLEEGPDSALRFVSDYHTLRKILRKRLATIIDKFSIAHPGDAYQKYLDIDRWLYESMRRFYFLGLKKSKEKKAILDLGTGAGYFPFICNYYGHKAEAIDVPDNPMYNEIIRELGITRYTQYIRAFKDLEINKQYDLITAAMICFNNHKTSNVWHIKEWDYFLKSVSRRNLKPDGQFFLSFNSETEEEPVNKELLEYFVSNNGDLNNVEVFLKREAFLLKSSEAVA